MKCLSTCTPTRTCCVSVRIANDPNLVQWNGHYRTIQNVYCACALICFHGNATYQISTPMYTSRKYTSTWQQFDEAAFSTNRLFTGELLDSYAWSAGGVQLRREITASGLTVTEWINTRFYENGFLTIGQTIKLMQRFRNLTDRCKKLGKWSAYQTCVDRIKCEL